MVEAGIAPQTVENTVDVLQFTVTPATSLPQPVTPSPIATRPAAPPIPSELTATPFPNFVEGELPAGPAAYLLPLTTRHLGEDRAVLFFELSEPGEGYLLYQEILPGQLEAEVVPPGLLEVKAIPFSAAETRQQLTLDGLTPGTEYLAVVGVKDAQGTLRQPAFLGENWGSVRFRTLSGRVPLRVGVFGDASFGDPATEALVQQMAGQDLDFVLHTGDVVAKIQENSGPVEAYALKYYQTLAPLLHQLPIYTVIGNHDYDQPARWKDSYFYYYAFPPFPDPPFGDAPQQGKQQYYAFAVHGIQFLMLDSQVIFGVSGREAQAAWMAERLADPRFRYTIPVFHVSPFFSGAVHPEDQIPVRRSWHPVFASARVPLAVSGHSHHYERLAIDGITYIVSGGGSRILYAPGEVLPQSQVFARRTHFVLLEIYPDRIELSAVDKDGEWFDQAAVPLP